jgi:hypothetical protein
LHLPQKSWSRRDTCKGKEIAAGHQHPVLLYRHLGSWKNTLVMEEFIKKKENVSIKKTTES